MKVKYFPDTDTALVEFSERKVDETREIGEDIYIHLDRDGSLVSMTIEHAKANAGLWEFSYQKVKSHVTPHENVAEQQMNQAKIGCAICRLGHGRL